MSGAAIVILATARTQIADYMQTLISVYVILILLYILSTLFFSFGGSVPYNRVLNGVLEFLRQTCEPYLRLFRRFIPPLGPLDLSPMVAIIALYVVGGLVVGLIRG
jgi:YggT family protein